jgi:hypothetical protein
VGLEIILKWVFTFQLIFFLKRFIAHKIYTACSRTSYEIVPLTNLIKYLQQETSDTKVNKNIGENNGSEKLLKKKTL